ncbi:hypothetical protein JKA74_10490 [Marivirga sp. S37H4]|uniref:Uncharacterized protein n=1 Tax=Marivirga aurantiaca TaxID=2802615 RepID=A0A935C8F1_9BACT|nr:hypothetical protein [Marivirga aurantiaca]MBK6265465.1 hypothetical protein [Marivirga aurantiaca]
MSVQKALPDYNVRDISLLSWLDRCYILDIIIQVDEEVIKVVSLYVSIIVPFYSVLYIENNVKNNGLNSQFSSNDLNKYANNEILKKVDEILQKFNYTAFPQKLLYKKIPDIAFKDKKMGEFTFFDAYFVHEIPHKI